MNLEDIFRADNFYALSFEEALPELRKFMYHYLGIFPLRKGERPQTNGKCIILEGRKVDFKDDKAEPENNRNLSLYLSDLLHEVLHIREGSFLVDAKPFLDSFENRALAHTIFNIVEDGRIEFNAQDYLKPDDTDLLKKSNEYYASKKSFQGDIGEQVMCLFASKVIVKGNLSQFNPKILAEENAIVQAAVENKELNAEGIYSVDDLLQKMEKLADEVYGGTVKETWKSVPQIYELLVKAFPKIEKDFPQEDSCFGSVSAPILTSENRGDTQQVYMGFHGDAHDFSEGEKKGNTLQALIGKEEDAQEGNSKETPLSDILPSSDLKKTQPEIMQIITYDHLKKAYIHLHDLQIVSYERKNLQFLQELSAYDHLARIIIEYFEMLKPNSLQRIQFSETPDDLNMEAVIEVLADPSLMPQAKVCDSYIINQRDSLNGILIDISGSTGFRLKSGKRVIDVEKITAGIIYRALTEIGDTVNAYAFSSDNKTKLYQLPGLESIGALEPEHANADGVAIRGVVSEMNKISAKDKTLYVISDGKPNDPDYYGEGAIIDTSMAFMEAENQGIRTVYFNIDNEASEYFATLVKNTTFAQSMGDVEKLPYVVSEFVLQNG